MSTKEQLERERDWAEGKAQGVRDVLEMERARIAELEAQLAAAETRLAASPRTPPPEVLRAALVDWHAAMTASIAADEAVNGGDGPYDLLMLRAVNAARDADKASKRLMDTLAVVLAEFVRGGDK